jgi:Ca-activated chloride channel family protein
MSAAPDYTPAPVGLYETSTAGAMPPVSDSRPCLALAPRRVRGRMADVDAPAAFGFNLRSGAGASVMRDPRVVARGLAMAAAVVACAGAAGAQTFRSGVDLVSFGVTVVDRKGSLIAELTADDFEIYEEGRRQVIRHFARGDVSGLDAPPMHLGLLLDTSGSMERDIGFARTAAVRFLNSLQQAVDVTLVDFDTEVRVARYGQADFARLIERIRARKADGYTALYDALGVYLDGSQDQEGRTILVLYTDGGDTRSTLSYGALGDMLKASDVTLYAIGFLDYQSTTVRMEQRMRLQQMAELTGGRAFFPTSLKMLDEVYAQVLAEIAAQYSLGFVSLDGTADGAWRDVEIRLTRPDLRDARIRTRKGYFAPFRSAGASR